MGTKISKLILLSFLSQTVIADIGFLADGLKNAFVISQSSDNRRVEITLCRKLVAEPTTKTCDYRSGYIAKATYFSLLEKSLRTSKNKDEILKWVSEHLPETKNALVDEGDLPFGVDLYTILSQGFTGKSKWVLDIKEAFREKLEMISNLKFDPHPTTGGHVGIGRTGSLSDDYRDLMVFKVSPQGKLLFKKRLPKNLNLVSSDISISEKSGAIAVLSRHEKEEKLTVWDKRGNLVWEKPLPHRLDDFSGAISWSQSGKRLYVSGEVLDKEENESGEHIFCFHSKNGKLTHTWKLAEFSVTTILAHGNELLIAAYTERSQFLVRLKNGKEIERIRLGSKKDGWVDELVRGPNGTYVATVFLLGNYGGRNELILLKPTSDGGGLGATSRATFHPPVEDLSFTPDGAIRGVQYIMRENKLPLPEGYSLRFLDSKLTTERHIAFGIGGKAQLPWASIDAISSITEQQIAVFGYNGYEKIQDSLRLLNF